MGTVATFPDFMSSGVVVPARRVRNSIRRFHPEIIVGRIEDAYGRKRLQPVRCEIAGYNQTRGKSVEHRQRLVIHRVSNHTFVDDGIRQIERLHEPIRAEALGSEAPVQPFKLHLHRAALHAGGIENLAEFHAGPSGIAHRAVSPLPSRDSRLQPAAAIAGALIHRGNRYALESSCQFRKTERQRAFDISFHMQAPLFQIHRIGNGLKMPADKKRIVGSERSTENNGAEFPVAPDGRSEE